MLYPKPHPVKAILASRRITIRALGSQVKCNPQTLGRVINGYEAPWPALKTRISRALEVPESALFRSLEEMV